MKKLRKCLNLMLALALILAGMPHLNLVAHAADTSGKCGDNLSWSFDESTGTLTITGSGEMADWNYGEVPWLDIEIRAKIKTVSLPEGMTSIGSYAFRGCDNLSDFIIPSTVTEINDFAFEGCKKLTELVFPAGMTRIGMNAIRDCTGLKNISFSGAVTKMDEWSFLGCTGLTEITIPEGTEYIGASAFAGCANLTTISIPKSITYIGMDAFSGTALTSTESWVGECLYIDHCLISARQDAVNVVIRPGTTVIAEGAFLNHDVLMSVTIPEGVATIGVYAFRGCTRLVDISIPGSVTKIDIDAFEGCQSLKTITLPKKLQTIGEHAFANCNGLTKIEIPRSVTEIGIGAFCICQNLKAIEVDSGNAAFSSVDGVLFSKDQTELMAYPCGKTGAYQIPEGVERIEQEAFYVCTGLSSVTIPNTVLQIGLESFFRCEVLTNVILPNSVQYVDNLAFLDCKKLGKVYVLNPECKLGANCFPDTVLYGYEKSTTEQYALRNACVFKALASGTGFVDVEKDVFYAEAVTWAVEKEVTNGIDDTHFGSEKNCTRGQVVTFLWRAAGCPEPYSTETPFTDMKPGAFYEKAVAWAVEEGITYGIDETHFGPDDSCTRAQVVALLYRFAGYPGPVYDCSPFGDINPQNYFFDAVSWASVNGITKGVDDSHFNPDGVCTRAQVVTFLYRVEKYMKTYRFEDMNIAA